MPLNGTDIVVYNLCPDEDTHPYEGDFEAMWKALICDDKGRVKRKKAFDILTNMSRLCYEITGGLVTDPTTAYSDILDIVNQLDNAVLQEVLAHEKLQWEAEKQLDVAVEDVCHISLERPTQSFEGVHARVTTPKNYYFVAYSTNTDQLITDLEIMPIGDYRFGPALPLEWHDVAKEGIKALLGGGK